MRIFPPSIEEYNHVEIGDETSTKLKIKNIAKTIQTQMKEVYNMDIHSSLCYLIVEYVPFYFPIFIACSTIFRGRGCFTQFSIPFFHKKDYVLEYFHLLEHQHKKIKKKYKQFQMQQQNAANNNNDNNNNNNVNYDIDDYEYEKKSWKQYEKQMAINNNNNARDITMASSALSSNSPSPTAVGSDNKQFNFKQDKNAKTDTNNDNNDDNGNIEIIEEDNVIVDNENNVTNEDNDEENNEENENEKLERSYLESILLVKKGHLPNWVINIYENVTHYKHIYYVCELYFIEYNHQQAEYIEFEKGEYLEQKKYDDFMLQSNDFHMNYHKNPILIAMKYGEKIDQILERNLVKGSR